MDPNPRLVIIVGRKGVDLVRLVSQNDREEQMCMDLYQKVKKQLRKIDKVARGEDAR